MELINSLRDASQRSGLDIVTGAEGDEIAEFNKEHAVAEYADLDLDEICSSLRINKYSSVT